MPFPADVLAWTLAAALLFAFGRIPTPTSPVQATAPTSAQQIGMSADSGPLLAHASAFTEWTAPENAGRRDTVRPRGARQRVATQPPGSGQAWSRARAINTERLGFLRVLASARTGIPAAGHTSLPPPIPARI